VFKKIFKRRRQIAKRAGQQPPEGSGKEHTSNKVLFELRAFRVSKWVPPTKI
jgi:hypothetical protein